MRSLYLGGKRSDIRGVGRAFRLNIGDIAILRRANRAETTLWGSASYPHLAQGAIAPSRHESPIKLECAVWGWVLTVTRSD